MRAHRDMVRMFWTVVAIGLFGSLWSECAHAQVAVEISAGTGISTASDAPTDVTPFARVAAAVPLASWRCGESDWRCAPRLHIRTDLGGTSGAVVDVADPSTFRSIDFAGGVSQKITEAFFPEVYCEAGASALFGDTRGAGALRWFGCGARMDHYGRGWINVLFTGDQRLGGGYRPAVAVQGALALYQAKDTSRMPEGTRVSLVGTGVFGVSSAAYTPDSPTSVISVGITAGYGR